MTDVVVDASLAAQWVLIEPYSAEALALLADWDTRRVRRLVPTWFACEVSNVLYKRMLRGQLTLARAKVALEVVLRHVVPYEVDPSMIGQRALDLADQFARPASYDAYYLALSEHLGCELWTADQRLWNSTRATLAWVRWVGEVTAAP